MVGPIASLSQLHRSDGSASYKCPATGYSILGAVNGPIELPARRDALKPEEATVEVFVKPGTTTGGGKSSLDGRRAFPVAAWSLLWLLLEERTWHAVTITLLSSRLSYILACSL
ncbi:hypothetical protein DTO012A8_10192 [Penicillium roqueforti]|nr:hypothetical protein DTO012A8_10192 [Penicillium roqueforti]